MVGFLPASSRVIFAALMLAVLALTLHADKMRARMSASPTIVKVDFPTPIVFEIIVLGVIAVLSFSIVLPLQKKS